jgi:hypothetical protein
MISKTAFTFVYQGTLRVLAAAAGLALTVGLFLVLPLLESITSTAQTDMIVQGVNTALPPPPPPPPVEEKKEEEKPGRSLRRRRNSRTRRHHSICRSWSWR